jgi:signal transduction histidine kinase
MNKPLPWLDRLAHDLRGPLMPMQTASYLLRRGELDPERQQELFVLIERQTRRLARMIDELSDWTQASRHGLIGAREPCELVLLLDNAIGAAAAAGRELPAVADETGEARINGDPARLTQLLRILFEFAARAGQAQVSMRIAADRVQIDVLDVQANATATEAAALLEQPMAEPFDEGLGLTLLIARAIAEAHDGTLLAEAGADGGLRLRCELPLLEETADQPQDG